MMDEDMVRAQRTFNTLCEEFDKRGLNYKKDEDHLRISCGIKGDDLLMDIDVLVDAKRQLIVLMSRLPFVVPETKRLEVAIAVTFANNQLVDGSFDYDIRTGNMYFRLTSSFIDSEVNGEVFSYMLVVSSNTIDEFNDQFFMMSKGVLSIDQFIRKN